MIIWIPGKYFPNIPALSKQIPLNINRRNFKQNFSFLMQTFFFFPGRFLGCQINASFSPGFSRLNEEHLHFPKLKCHQNSFFAKNLCDMNKPKLTKESSILQHFSEKFFMSWLSCWRLDSNIESKLLNQYFIYHHQNIQINMKYLNIIEFKNLAITSTWEK